MRFILLFLTLLFTASGSLKGLCQGIPGKIVTLETLGYQQTWRFYGDPSFTKKSVLFRTDNGTPPRKVCWMYRQDKVVGTVVFRKKDHYLNSEIDQFDLTGKINSTLYRSDSTEVLYDPFVSWDDSKAVFQTWKLENQSIKKPQYGRQSIVILSIEGKKLIDRVTGADSVHFLSESPWLYGSEQFIYTTTVQVDKTKNERSFFASVYLYDLPSKSSQLIISDGLFAVCSPKEKKIAYSIEHDLWILDIENKSNKKLYESRGYIANIKWAPEGNKILLEISRGWREKDRFIYIDLLTGSESPAPISSEMKYFSWK